MPSKTRTRRVMRLFLAVHPSTQFTEQLTTGLDPLRDRLPLKWTRPDSWHLTLQFLGAWPEARANALKRGLAAGSWGRPFVLQPGGLGVFPNWRRPRVLFLHMTGDGQLEALAQAAREVVSVAWPDGPQDDRPFQAHLTLARIKAPLGKESLNLLRNTELSDLPQVKVEGFGLMASRLTGQGAVHSEQAFFPLSRP